MPPQSNLPSRSERVQRGVAQYSPELIIPLHISTFPYFLLLSLSARPARYDLDACDIQEKYPDLFQVNLNIEVDPRDKPSTKPPPWDGFQTKGLNPKILFSTRDEQQEILSKFGEQRLFNGQVESLFFSSSS